MRSSDTIIAQATPPGFGSVGILRISGNRTAEIAQAILGKLPIPRYASYLPFSDSDGNVLDKGIAIWFPAPNSFTGEDVLEIQGHGGPIILDMLLNSILALQIARIANPGEFSERAFLNKKIDLAQAEAIFDLIHASSEQAARSAIKSLQGSFSLKINCLLESLIYLRTQVEVTIDFPDENIDIISDRKIEMQLNKVIDNLYSVLAEATQGRLIREGMKIVIAGRPNSGKSSLLNALVGHKSAIVTDIPGTTCDVIREHIHIDGMPLHIIDTAGIRKATNDIERIGIEYAWQEIKDADHVLLVVDSSISKENDVAVILPDFITHLPIDLPITVVRNKADITGESIGLNKIHNQSLICLSARTGEGIDILKTYLKDSMGFSNHVEGSFLARSRHLQALKLAKKHLKRGKEQLLNTCSSELLAEELHLAQQALNQITGKFTTDDLLKNIFSCFCIGK